MFSVQKDVNRRITRHRRRRRRGRKAGGEIEEINRFHNGQMVNPEEQGPPQQYATTVQMGNPEEQGPPQKHTPTVKIIPIRAEQREGRD